VKAEVLQLDRRIGILLAVLCGLAIGVFIYAAAHPPLLTGYDFEAFWCGAKALLQHASPYTNEPLHACEATTSPAFFLRYPQVTVPVPLPGYAIALFTPFALIPFALARIVWLILQVFCALVIGRGIAKLSGMPPLTALAASGLAVLGPALLQGALSPIPIALTVCAALALRRKQWNAATILLGFAMVEPHMVLPACVAVFLTIPQMRIRLLAAGAGAAAVMLAVLGPQIALSYFTTVLPLHAASEVNNLGQLSLTALLYHLGAAPALALRLGSLQYVLLALLGVFAARALYLKQDDRSWLVLLPAAFAVTGGAFIHLDEVAMAVPLACVIVMRRPNPFSMLALLMLAMPVASILDWFPLSVPAAMLCVWLMARPEFPLRRVIANGILPAATALVVVGGAFALHSVAAEHAQQAVTYIVNLVDPGGTANASATWFAYNSLAQITPLWWAQEAWTLLPLAILVTLSVRESLAGDAGGAEWKRLGGAPGTWNRTGSRP